MIPYAKASIPIAAGDDFYAYIPVSIDTSVYKLIPYTVRCYRRQLH